MNPVLDYDGDGERDILVKIYVDGESVPKVTGYTPYGTTSHYDPVRLEAFGISVAKDSVADVFLDNLKYWQVERTPDGGGAPPVEKNDEPLGDNGNALDEDGWA